jgi:hypothetical protein
MESDDQETAQSTEYVPGVYNNTAIKFIGGFIVVLILAMVLSNLFQGDQTPKTYEEDPAVVELRNAGVISTDFDAFKKDFDSKTQIQQKEFWDSVKGKKTQWNGNVSQIRTGYIDSSINVVEVSTKSGVFKAVFPSTDKTLSKINKGDKITVRGVITSLGGTFTSWEISDAQIR